MGGIVGRMFREFAVTISIAILVSGFVSLTLTPMLCSHFLRGRAGGLENPLGRMLEGAFQGLLVGYRASLRHVLKHRFSTLLVTFATIGGTIYAYQLISKGFFPSEDTGVVIARTQARQGIRAQIAMPGNPNDERRDRIVRVLVRQSLVRPLGMKWYSLRALCRVQPARDNDHCRKGARRSRAAAGACVRIRGFINPSDRDKTS